MQISHRRKSEYLSPVEQRKTFEAANIKSWNRTTQLHLQTTQAWAHKSCSEHSNKKFEWIGAQHIEAILFTSRKLQRNGLFFTKHQSRLYKPVSLFNSQIFSALNSAGSIRQVQLFCMEAGVFMRAPSSRFNIS
jgi:hypothetical protein